MRTRAIGFRVAMMFSVLLLALLAVIGYLLWKWRKADANLTLLLHRAPISGYFRDKVFWITGASSGIGESLVRALSEDGARLILSSRNQEQLERVRESLANPSNAKVLAVDLSKAETLSDIATQAWNLFGHIDVLINNAGISCRVPADEVTEDLVRKIMEVDFFGQIILTQSILPNMIKCGCGQIVNISSLAGKFGVPLRAPYCAAKFALNGYMECLQIDMVGKGISVCNIMPGPVKTNVSKNALIASGEAYGATDQLIANGMKVERCTELILRAIASNLEEVWIAEQPYLLVAYIAQFRPRLLKWIMRKRHARAAREAYERSKDQQS